MKGFLIRIDHILLACELYLWVCGFPESFTLFKDPDVFSLVAAWTVVSRVDVDFFPRESSVSPSNARRGVG